MSRVLLEVAVESFEGAVAAERAGADRLELCSRLDVGGLTPSVEFFQRVRAAVSIPIVVMIRPREGRFVYWEEDIEGMTERIGQFRPSHPDGFVFGALRPDGSLDAEACERLVGACGGIPAVFHRAWDEVPRSRAELETLIALGFRRLLTSGCAEVAVLGVPNIRVWIEAVAGRIEILPGSGISPGNAAMIVRWTGCDQVHGTFKNCLRETRGVLDQLAGAG